MIMMILVTLLIMVMIMMILGDLGDNGDDQDDPGDIGESLYTCKKEDVDTDRTYAPSNNLQKTPPCSVVCFVRYV